MAPPEPVWDTLNAAPDPEAEIPVDADASALPVPRYTGPRLLLAIAGIPTARMTPNTAPATKSRFATRCMVLPPTRGRESRPETAPAPRSCTSTVVPTWTDV